MKLYYLPGACSLADHIVLEWSGLSYETQPVAREEMGGAEFRKISPSGAVPVITDGDWALTQNVAILEYIAEQAPQANLLGDGTARSRAEVRRWLAFANADIHKAFSLIFGTPRYISGDAEQDALRANAATILRTLFGVANAQLAGRDWIAGTPSHSVADAYLYVMLVWAKVKNIDLSGYDNLAAFKARMDADAGVQKALKDEGLV